MITLVDVLDIFYFFFLLGEGEGGVRGAREGGGVGFLLKIPRGGGGFPGGEGAGRVSAVHWGIFAGGGGGLNIFFRGRNVHQVTGRTKLFSNYFRGLYGKSCKSPRGYYRGGGALQDRSPYRRLSLVNYFSGALQENPVIAAGQLHEKMFTELFW